ncbi:MAG: MFS transporter [Halanaerobiaceae bacterium]
MFNKQIRDQIKSGNSYWYNFFILSLDSGAFNFAINMLSHLTIVPYYISTLTDSNFIIGLAPVIFIMGRFFPQVFAANYVNGLKQRKRYLVTWVAAERVGILLIFLSVFFFAEQDGFIAIFSFLVAYAFFSTTLGMVMPAHSDLVARSIDKNRGIFYGVSFFVGGIAGIIGAQLASRYLDLMPFPISYYYVFGLPIIVTTISLIFWYFIKEPKFEYETKRMETREYIQFLIKLLKENIEYSKFILVRIVLNLCEIATPFYSVYATIKFDISPGVVGLFTMVMLVSQSFANLLWGYIGNKYGFKRVLQCVTLLGITATILALTATKYYIFYFVYVLVGAMYSSVNVANVNLAIEFSRPDMTPTFVGLMNTLQAPALAFASMFGGIIADSFGYSVTIFIGLLLFAFSAIFTTLFMKDPREIKEEVV